MSELPAWVREAFMEAYALLGGAERLAAWGCEDPAAFYALFAKLTPPPPADALPGWAEVSEAPLTDAEWQDRATGAA